MRDLLQRRWAPALLAVILGLALTLPSVATGLAADDWFQLGLYTGSNPLASSRPIVLSLFEFFPAHGDRERVLQMGLVPWWGAEDATVAFFRPLSALTHLVDYAAAPGRWALWHAHSLAWYALLIGVVAVWYRRWLGPYAAAAGLATLLFAVADRHAMVVGWLANRNALISATLALAGLLLHQSGRDQGRPPLQLGGAALFGLALLAGESAVGALAYLGAWELCCGPGSLRRRGLAVGGWLVVLVVWRSGYDALGYGAHNLGLYVDPGRDLGLFAGRVGSHAPWLLLGQWAPIPPDLALLLPRGPRLAGVAVGIALAVALAAWAWPVLRRDRHAQMLALGSLLALVPVSATLPMDRLLLWSGLGATGLLARVALAPRTDWRSRASRVLLVIHGPLAAALLAARCAGMPLFAATFAGLAREAPRDAAFADQTLIALNGNEIPLIYLYAIRGELGGPTPAGVVLLSGLGRGEVTALDAHTVRLDAPEGLFTRPIESALVSPSQRFTPGTQVERGPVQVTVVAVTPDGRPSTIDYRFADPLTSDRYRWVAVQGGHVAEVAAPQRGVIQPLRGGLGPPAPPLPGEAPAWVTWLLAE